MIDERLGKLIGKPKEYTVGGVKMMLRPLSMENIDLVLAVESEDMKEKGDAMHKLATLYLKEQFPEASDEEIQKVGMVHFKELLGAIMDVNQSSQ
jgi:hypothetical protein